MGQSEPPAVYLLWCPKCGRVRWEPKPSHAEECDGEPIRVQYAPVRQQPLRGQSDVHQSGVIGRCQPRISL
jgi:hypothetical protein